MASHSSCPAADDRDETTPLLLNTCNAEAQNPSRRVTPLPKAQIAALCLVRLVDPIAFTQIFPYINEFIAFLHVTDDPSQIGYFSGLVESTFAVSQLLFIYHWARLSDVIGRRPVIMTGTLGVALSTMYFGVSSSIIDLLISRCIAGVFAGTASVVHTVLGEITGEKSRSRYSTNQAAAFPLYGLVWPIGSIIGPLIGGSFSTPASQFSIFKQTIFDRHPYFLPCFVAGLLSIVGFTLAYFYLGETLSTKRRFSAEKDRDYMSCTSEHNTDCHDDIPVSPSARELLSFPIIRALSLSGFALEANGTSFGVLYVLFCYSPIHSGGLAFPPSTIGYSLAFAGVIAGSVQVFLMPFLLRRIEAAKIYNLSIAAWPVTFLFLPTLNMIARYGLDESTGQLGSRSHSALWVGIVIVLVLSRVGGIAYSASMILIRNNVPKPSYLGSANGLVQSSMCFSRCVSAAFASSVFAFSDKYNVLGGYFWALLHASIALIGCSLARDITRNSKNMLTES
ncbi:major facilitator superfamily domain-containing protein [Lentinula aff. lateritia]|uniref:Major facilitator superfamily domain-containing protein n=1 Tax=Lentinula aff. lateritia TaxID=2804960 RepID=A0ACC1TSA2_9AGAR|nr:major facilitator superfamily domain-containing protein [Lentinula aff. lateritia]